MDPVSRTFSGENRANHIEELKEKGLEVLVIGGGITGAGIALDARVRGFNTGIIDQHDFSGGSSSRSNKLIQGGLSELKHLDVKAFAELGRERAVILDNAPHLVSPISMLMPVYKKGAFGRIQASLSLRIYDRWVELNKKDRRHMLNKKQIQKQEPLLRTDNLKGGGLYTEYQLNDARLTIEVLKVATTRGAVAANYLKAESFLYEQGKVVGVMAVDQLTGEAHKIFANYIVNAAGSNMNHLREQDRSLDEVVDKTNEKLHVVIDRKSLPIQQGIYFESKDGQMLYAIPFGEKIYVGSAYVDRSSKDGVSQAIQTLLDSLNHTFQATPLMSKQIESFWIDTERSMTNQKLNKTEEIVISSSGLRSVYCHHTAGYRVVAERVIDSIEKEHSRSFGSQTDSITLSGGQVGGLDRFEDFLKTKAEEGEALGLTYDEAYALSILYGSNITNIWSRVRTSRRRAAESGLPPILFAQLTYAIEEEMVVSPLDFLVRRTHALYFNRPLMEKWMNPIFRYMQDRFQWDEQESMHWQDELDKELAKHSLSDTKNKE